MCKLTGSWAIWMVAVCVGVGAVLADRGPGVASAEESKSRASPNRHSITVHSNRWQGIWRIFDRTTGARVAIRADKHTPSQTITLPAGSYRIFPTARTNYGEFRVDEDGNTHDEDPLYMALYRGPDITFRTFSIPVDSGSWQGLWAINNGAIRPSKTAPVSPLTLVHNMRFEFHLCNAGGAGTVELVTTAQALVSVGGAPALRFERGVLRVQTTPVVIDSQDIGTTTWAVPNGPARQHRGRSAEELMVPPGTWVAFQLSPGGPRTTVTLDRQGRVAAVAGHGSRRGEKLVALRRPETGSAKCRWKRPRPALPGY